MAETLVNNSNKSLDYQAEGKAKNVNAVLHKVVTPGIVEGGTLTYASASSVTVSNFVAYVQDDTLDITVREESLAAFDVTVTHDTSWVVLREEWSDTAASYIKIVSCDSGDILATDVIIGRTIWQGGVLSTDFDYTERQEAITVRLDGYKDAFQITPVNLSTVSYDKKVNVAAGKAIINGKEIVFGGGDTTDVSDTTDGRIDFVYLDDTGSVGVIEGTDAAVPLEPVMPENAIILGKITRGAAATHIDGSHITQFRFDEYVREFAGKVDTLQVQGKILTGGDAGADIEDGGAVFDGDTTTGTIVQVKGGDGDERLSIDGAGKIVNNNDAAADQTFLDSQNPNVAGGTQFKQTAGAAITTITTKGASAAVDPGKTVISNNGEGVIIDIPASKDWEIQEGGVTKVKYDGGTDTLEVENLKINSEGQVFEEMINVLTYTNYISTNHYFYEALKDGFLFGNVELNYGGPETYYINEGGYVVNAADSDLSIRLNAVNDRYSFCFPVKKGKTYYFSKSSGSSYIYLTVRARYFGS